MQRIFTSITFFFICLNLQAQNASLSGKVYDENGLVLPGATVKLVDKATITDVNGSFYFPNLTTGDQEIHITYIGYNTLDRSVGLSQGTNSQNFEMHSGITLQDEVIILGDRLKGQAKALNQQKTNANITNVVSSDQVGKFPDANIGDALKRIPGITMQNDQGEARDIVIRGMAPQFNAVTLNGERIPSAEGDNRKVQMDLIPSDMIQTIQVNKAVLPNMDADAIGGSVNLVTRKAPNDLRISGTLGSGINMLSKKPIYNGAFVIGNRILNEKLGFVLSGSYNNHNFGSDNVEAVWVETDAGAVIDEFDIRKYTVQRVRRSLSANFDYDLSPNHSIGFSAMYNWRDDWENRLRMRVSQLEDAFDDGDFTTDGNGLYNITAARVEYQTKGGIDSDRVKAKRLEDQRVWNYTLNGNHRFDKLQATWNVTLAKASEERPGERYISFRDKGQVVNLDIRDTKSPSVYLANRADNLAIGLDAISEQYEYTSDKDLNAKLDFQLPYSNKGVFKFGGRLRTKEKLRDQNYFEYEEVNETITDLASVSNADYSDLNFLPGSQYQVGQFATPEFLGNLDLNNTSVFEKKDVPEEYISGIYSANESITGAYVMVDQQLNKKLSAILGLRYEYTNIDYTGNIYNIDEETVSQDSRDNAYGNLLPGVHLKYDLRESAILRFAWTNTIARPSYYDLVPFANFSPQDSELERGNPDLKASTASNLDVMAENYFKNIGIVSAGFFYKNISNFIYSQTIQNYADPVFGTDLEYTLPKNGGTAEVVGMELALQRQLWKGFGIYLNYTYTHSATTGIEEREDEDLALPGTANNMFNASLSYENKKLVARVSLNYASDYVDEIGGSAFEDRFYDKQTFLDVNAAYAFTPAIRLYIEGNNLTNQPLRYYQGISSRTMQKEFYNARYNVGLKFDLSGKK
ncbi:TonB-dependent receptor [Arcticibacterium luteifluviistationis]|uniref:TonB-dependent receptor n=1 Tax=Arcticibacterium luteifluviistationis TaxID=1784714 RepID=A0A2Z4GG31_9BACT|nr:TonB-dependent receptor [Arcticibacterium luteifluviistationis]AWW00018.1 TonB-dependent receptor [Arcticibacterium luteifluviistationis]